MLLEKRKKILVYGTFLGILLFCLETGAAQDEVKISGELKQWHTVTLTFAGPEASETGEPNPFRFYRLTAAFSHEGKTVIVPGYFAADGNAADSSAESGRQWRVHFVPDQTGKWTYKVSFVKGRDAALSGDSSDGEPTSFDGASGEFTIAPSDKKGSDFRARGRLQYVGGHYLQFAESGEYFIKGGADSPENFLGYADFDGTSQVLNDHVGLLREGEAPISRLHAYEPHVKDWRPGDPTWKDGKGKGMIGALNYLAGKGMNSVYFLTMNVEGDGRDVWPWIDMNARDRFDCSKLDQWEIVFSHMEKLGLLMHVITQETENDQLINGGELGLERKLYYKELIARFGHHLALVWNLGEENTNTTEQIKAFSKYIHSVDPYDHPVVVHTYPGQYDKVYTPLLGFRDFQGPSLQMGDFTKTHAETIKWIDRSKQADHPWIVCLDEIGPAHTGVKPDADDPEHREVRHHALWGNLMAGGAGVEWYFGYKFAHNDLNCEDWRSRDAMWDFTRIALDFFQNHLPFTGMKHHDELTEDQKDYCFAKPGEVYAVYLPQGGSTKIDLGPGNYSVQWYDPRHGGDLQKGSIESLSGPGEQSIGLPPGERKQDWAVLIRKK
ncbi:MAG: DUF5060 domain-containing protein [Candidatus Hinthialibacter sp.]